MDEVQTPPEAVLNHSRSLLKIGQPDNSNLSIAGVFVQPSGNEAPFAMTVVPQKDNQRRD